MRKDGVIFMFLDGSMQGLPIERMYPYGEDYEDFMMMMSPELGLRLCGIHTADKHKFKVKKIIESEKESFKTPDLSKRMEKFLKLKDARLERHFGPEKKDPYLFFDPVEQDYLREEAFKSLDLYCSVDFYERDQASGQMYRVELADIPLKQRNRLIRECDKLKLRAVLQLRSWYPFSTAAKGEGRRVQVPTFSMDGYFRRYPKLKEIKTQEAFKRYRKFLAKKYHPDTVMDEVKKETVQEIFKKVAEDMDELEKSVWFKNLEQAPKEG